MSVYKEARAMGFIIGLLVLYVCLVALVAPVVAQRLRQNFEED